MWALLGVESREQVEIKSGISDECFQSAVRLCSDEMGPLRKVSLGGSSKDDRQIDNRPTTHLHPSLLQGPPLHCVLQSTSSLHCEKGIYILFVPDIRYCPSVLGIL